MDTLPDTLAVVEVETLSARLGNAVAEALVEMLPDTLEEMKADTLGDRLSD